MILHYRLNYRTLNFLHVRGAAEGGDGALQLIDASGVLSRIIPEGPVVTHPSGKFSETVATGAWRFPLRRGRGSFRYTLRLFTETAERTEAMSIVKGNRCLFFLGRAIFLRVFPSEARYRIGVEKKAVSSLSRKGTGWEAENGRQLSLAGFLLGDFFNRSASDNEMMLRLVGEREMEAMAGRVQPVLLRLVRAMTVFFGSPACNELSFFILRDNRNLSSSERGVGSGLSFQKGVFLLFKKEEAVSEPDIWLILHEVAHQWLGMGVFAGEPGLEWFFEGMASWCAMTVAHELGYLPEQRLHKLLTRDAEHYLTSAENIIGRREDNIGDFHQYRVQGGLLSAYGLDLFFRKNAAGGLRDFLALFYQKFRGGLVSESDILGTMEKFSGRAVPEFIRDFLEQRELLPFQNWF